MRRPPCEWPVGPTESRPREGPCGLQSHSGTVAVLRHPAGHELARRRVCGRHGHAAVKAGWRIEPELEAERG